MFSSAETFLSETFSPFSRCILLSLSFVGSLYVWPLLGIKGNRDEPRIIRLRIISVVSVCLFSPFLLLGNETNNNNMNNINNLNGSPRDVLFRSLSMDSVALVGSFLSLALVAGLFMAPIADSVLDALEATSDSDDVNNFNNNHKNEADASNISASKDRDQRHARAMRGFIRSVVAPGDGLKFLRNLIVGPFAEEFCFRGIMGALLLVGQSRWSNNDFIVYAPLLFSTAHFHHCLFVLREHGFLPAVLGAAVQFGYTYFFFFN